MSHQPPGASSPALTSISSSSPSPPPTQVPSIRLYLPSSPMTLWDWVSPVSIQQSRAHYLEGSYLLKLLDGFLFGMDILARIVSGPNFSHGRNPLLCSHSNALDPTIINTWATLGGYACLEPLPRSHLVLLVLYSSTCYLVPCKPWARACTDTF